MGNNDGHADVICMAMDAFRLASGRQPRNFTVQQILDWLRQVAELLANQEKSSGT